MAAGIIFPKIDMSNKSSVKARVIKLVQIYNNDFEYKLATPATIKHMKAIKKEIVLLVKDNDWLPKIKLKTYEFQEN